MTVASYALHVFDASGARAAIIDSFTQLAYVRRVNSFGVLSFALRGDDDRLSLLADKRLVEVWRRRDEDAAWERELTALLRDERWSIDEDGLSRYEATALGLEHMLQWRVVNWAAGVDARSQFTADPAETIAKTLVTYNATSSASVVNGRKRAGAITGVAVAADAAGGTSLDFYCHGDNLLEALQKLAAIGGVDFDVQRTAAATYTFDTHAGQLGTDRSATVVFALERGNMGAPRYAVGRSTEKTVACVFGQGDGTDRDYVTRTGDNYSASNDVELYVDAKDIDKGDTAALNARGDAKLYDETARDEFSFVVLQTPSSAYREHYTLGDLVTVVNPFTAAALTQKIVAVTVSLDADKVETIEVETQTP